MSNSRLAFAFECEQEDFEMAVAKVMKKDAESNMSMRKIWK
jgi:hypothetical protein